MEAYPRYRLVLYAVVAVVVTAFLYLSIAVGAVALAFVLSPFGGGAGPGQSDLGPLMGLLAVGLGLAGALATALAAGALSWVIPQQRPLHGLGAGLVLAGGGGLGWLLGLLLSLLFLPNAPLASGTVPMFAAIPLGVGLAMWYARSYNRRVTVRPT